MRRAKRRLFNLFAFTLLTFAIYLNFFYKEQQPGLLRSKPAKQSTPVAADPLTTKALPAEKK